ncbi:MAG: WD40 repeat domain-containing protein [Flavobacteriales bacterium]
MKLVQQHILQQHSAAVYGLCVGRRGHTFFSVSADKYVAEWDLETMQQSKTAIRLEDHGYAVLFDETNNLLIVGTSSGSLHLLDLKSKKELRNLTFHTKGIFDLVLDSITGLLYLAGGDGVMSVWQYPGMELMRAIPLSSEKLRQLAIHPDQRLLGIASGDGVVRILDMNDHNEVAGFDAHKEGATSLAWHPAKPILLTGGKDAMLRAWNTSENYREVVSIEAHKYAIYSIVFDKQNNVFYTGSRDGSIKVWNATDLSVLQKIDSRAGGHSHSINKLILSGDLLISASDDRKIIIWKPEFETT